MDCIVVYFFFFFASSLNQFPECNEYTAKGVVYFSSCIAFSCHTCIPSGTAVLAKFNLNSASVNKVNIKKQLFWEALIKYMNSMNSLHYCPHSPVLSCPAQSALQNCNCSP